MLQTLPVIAIQKKPFTPHPQPQVFLTFRQLPVKVPSYWKPTISTAWSVPVAGPTEGVGQEVMSPLEYIRKPKWPAYMPVGTVQLASTAAALVRQVESIDWVAQPFILYVGALRVLQVLFWPRTVLFLIGQAELVCSPQQVAYHILICKSPPEQLRLQQLKFGLDEQSVISCTDVSTQLIPLISSWALRLLVVAKAQQLPQRPWLQTAGVQLLRSLAQNMLAFNLASVCNFNCGDSTFTCLISVSSLLFATYLWTFSSRVQGKN